MSVIIERLKNGIITENPTFVQVLAMCPTLAVTSSAKNGMGMGLATIVVLVASNIAVSLLRKLIPSKIRIPAYIVIIASFVTIIDMLMQGYVPALYKALGIFIPLIVVNCIILGRAEAYASKSSIIPSIFDALGQGIGFIISLTVLGIVRELLGAGTIFDIAIMPQAYQPATIMILAPGAFFTLGILMAIINLVNLKRSKDKGSCKLVEHDCSKCAVGCGRVIQS
jgi:Na+-translocating ferredoxin:NAD+ oxidoreductase subunit E